MAKTKRSNRDHAHQHQYPGLDNAVIAADLQALLTPALYAQQASFRQLGMRERVLNLSLMLAAVLKLLWRQVPSVQELTRMLAREDLLWCKAVQVSQQAVSQRFLSNNPWYLSDCLWNCCPNSNNGGNGATDGL